MWRSCRVFSQLIETLDCDLTKAHAADGAPKSSCEKHMSESFAELFEESLATVEMKPGSVISGIVVDMDDEWVSVHVGLKSEGIVPRSEFGVDGEEEALEIGDEVKVLMEAVDDGWGETRLSREKARREETWMNLERAMESGAIVEGLISGRVKGGYTVDIDSVRAFLPGSLVDVRPSREIGHLEGERLKFKVVKLDRKRNNVVISRRAALEVEYSAERAALLESLEEGQSLQGTVKNITEYGAFVDIGGVDGLLHITDMAWGRVRHPEEIVQVGDEIQVQVLKCNRERDRISLGIKQLTPDPWLQIGERYAGKSQHKAKVTNITEYGCFAALEEGIEGLVHVSEMEWTNKNVQPNKLLSVGDEIEVMVLETDRARRRISLGMKQCQPNPWEEFSVKHGVGDKIKGKIRSITEFGIFIGLDGNIDGLVHVSDISWDEAGEEAIKSYAKDQEIEALVLGVDTTRERISLGIKQIQEDAFTDYVRVHDKGAMVTGTITEVHKNEATVRLAEGVNARLKSSNISDERVDDAREHIFVGDEIEAKIVNVDHRKRVIMVSIKARKTEEERGVLDEHRQMVQRQRDEEVATTSIGSLLQKEIGRSE